MADAPGSAGATRLNDELRAAAKIAATTIGQRGGRTSRPAPADASGERRVEAARACPAWTEIDAADLVQRGRFFVSAATDAVYTPFVGAVWGTSGRIEFGEKQPLSFAVADGEVRLF